MQLRWLERDDPLNRAELDLRWRVLRAPLGHPREATHFPFDDQSLHLIALEGELVVGCVLFHPEGTDEGRLYQMAVDPVWQGQSIGRRLVLELESEVRRRGFCSVTLHARAEALGFYERLGYEVFGEAFTEVGIPHRYMRRKIR